MAIVDHNQQSAAGELATLYNLANAIGGELNVDLKPAGRWDFQRNAVPRPVMLYDVGHLAGLTFQQAKGLVFKNMAAALYSQGNTNVRELITTITKQTNAQVGPKTIAEASVLPLLKSAADERAQYLLRKNKYPGLKGDGDLPRWDQGYRRDYFLQQYQNLATVTPRGGVDAKGRSLYWNRVDTAIRGLVSGALTKDNLPEDMPWSQPLCDQIASLRNEKKFDGVLHKFPTLVKQIAKFRQEYEAEKNPPPPPSGNGDGDGDPDPNEFINNDDEEFQPGDKPNQNPPPEDNPFDSERPSPEREDMEETEKGGGAGDEEQPEDEDNDADADDDSGGGEQSDDEDEEDDDSGDGDGEDDEDDESDEDEESGGDTGGGNDEGEADDDGEAEEQEVAEADELDKIKAEAEKNKPAGAAGDISDEVSRGGYVGDTSMMGGGCGLGDSTGGAPFPNATWAQVVTTVQPYLSPIRKQIDRYLRENELVGRERSHRSGKFDARSAMKAQFNSNDRAYSRRNVAGQQSYAVMFVIDRSGSMEQPVHGSSAFPEVFEARHAVIRASENVRNQQRELDSLMANTHRWTAQAKLRRKRIEQSLENAKAAEAAAIAAADRKEQKSSFRTQYSTRGVGNRILMATRMAVAIGESLERYDEIQTAYGWFADYYKTVIGFRDNFNLTAKQKVLDEYKGTLGGTNINMVFSSIGEEFAKTDAKRKMLIILSDGEFGYGNDYEANLKEKVRKLEAQGVEFVVLTLGYSADTSKALLGTNKADELTEETVGRVLGKHLARLVKG